MKKDRKSNIELLGIVSMFMIVFSHVTWEGRFSYPKSITKNISKKIIPLTMGIYSTSNYNKTYSICSYDKKYISSFSNIYTYFIYINVYDIYSKKDTGIK